MSEKQEEHEMTTVEIDWHFLGKIKDLGNRGQCLPFKTKSDHRGHEIVQPLSGIYVWLLPEKNKKQFFTSANQMISGNDLRRISLVF